MKITTQWLREQGACPDHIAIVEREWGDSHEMTRETLARAVELNLDLDWLASKLLTAPAWKEYKQVTAPTLKEYERARDTAWEEYRRGTAPAIWQALQKQESTS